MVFALKTSVIIATYNGELYIKKQLESIKNQILKPDEVIIRDDCSTDNTVDIIKRFISDNKLSNWKLIINEENKGWKENFYYLMKYSLGDVIFYCDQDDVWKENRIKRTMDVFSKSDGVKCVMCSYDSIDGDGNLIVRGECDGRFAKITSRSRKYYNLMGCLMAYKKDLNKEIFSIVDSSNIRYFSPDQLLARISVFFDGFYEMNETLIEHRFHNRNVTNRADRARCLSGSCNLGERIDLLREQNEIMKRIMCVYDGKHFRKELDDANEMFVFTKHRIELLSKRTLNSFFKLIKHIKSNNKIVIIADVMYAMGVQTLAGKIFVGLKRW